MYSISEYYYVLLLLPVAPQAGRAPSGSREESELLSHQLYSVCVCVQRWLKVHCLHTPSTGSGRNARGSLTMPPPKEKQSMPGRVVVILVAVAFACEEPFGDDRGNEVPDQGVQYPRSPWSR